MQRLLFKQWVLGVTQLEGSIHVLQGCENESFLFFSLLAEVLVNSELLVSPRVPCGAVEHLKAEHYQAMRAKGS